MNDRTAFDTDGCVVLHDVFDAAALSAEFDAAMTDAFAYPAHVNAGSAGNRFRYVPMMSGLTPVSLALTRQLATVAEELLGAAVLPGRTKATCYLTGTGWHRDSDVALRTIGMLCYLEPLDAASGALQVVPGSHCDLRAAPTGAADVADGVEVLATRPGDVVVVDEHLLHSSTGGGRWRRQWRVDFLADECPPPSSSDADADADVALREYYAGMHAPGWDGGYDVRRYPSYGAAWRSLDSRRDRRLTELGAYAAAEAEERTAATAGAASRP